MNSRIYYVMPEYPSATQTFVANEASTLERLGIEVRRYALHTNDHGRLGAIRRNRHTAGAASPLAYLRVLSNLVQNLPEVAALFFLRPNSLRSKLRQLFALAHALRLSAILEADRFDETWLHAHFLGRALDVVSYARLCTTARLHTSATAHAADASAPESRERLKVEVRRLTTVIAASSAVGDLVEQSTGRRVDAIVHCGIEPARNSRSASMANRSRSRHLRIVTVARLVEKKGLVHCVEASEILRDRGIAHTWRIIGDGPLRQSLKSEIARRGLNDIVHLDGEMAHALVLKILEDDADLFVLPSVPSSSGDIDGIPVALMEAMTRSCPVVSTRISGIPELVIDDETGLLVEPGRSDQIAEAVERLSDPGLSVLISTRGKRYVDANFNQMSESEKLAEAIGMKPST